MIPKPIPHEELKPGMLVYGSLDMMACDTAEEMVDESGVGPDVIIRIKGELYATEIETSSPHKEGDAVYCYRVNEGTSFYRTAHEAIVAALLNDLEYYQEQEAKLQKALEMARAKWGK